MSTSILVTMPELRREQFIAAQHVIGPCDPDPTDVWVTAAHLAAHLTDLDVIGSQFSPGSPRAEFTLDVEGTVSEWQATAYLVALDDLGLLPAGSVLINTTTRKGSNP